MLIEMDQRKLRLFVPQLSLPSHDCPATACNSVSQELISLIITLSKEKHVPMEDDKQKPTRRSPSSPIKKIMFNLKGDELLLYFQIRVGIVSVALAIALDI